MTTPILAIAVHIDWDKVKCSNCMSCVIVCAERHTGTSAPASRIRIQVDLLLDNDVTAAVLPPVCGRPLRRGLPGGSHHFRRYGRAWLVDVAEELTRLGLATESPPVAALVLREANRLSR